MDLFNYFKEIEDPRMDRTKKHNLFDIIAIAICAVISNADSFVDIEMYGNAKFDWLKTFLELPNGIPSHDTFSRVFAILNPDILLDCFRKWIQDIVKKIDGEIISIDGKTARRSFDKVKGKSAIHIVSAWASQNQICLGQIKVNDKSNEITAIPELLKQLSIKDCIITIDAMGTQKAIAKTIIEGNADYVLALKKNQCNLYENAALYFEDAIKINFKDIRHGYHKTVDNEHGRIEIREYWITDEIGWLEEKTDWTGIKTIGMVKSKRILNDIESVEVRLHISSLKPDVQMYAKAVRGHWGIENSLHWVLDIAFREDEQRVRKDYAPENLSILRKFALNLFKKETSIKAGINAKRKKAGWDTDFLLKILKGI
jgi:predicted transposase YbfD/YdcC